jgi:membrane protein
VRSARSPLATLRATASLLRETASRWVDDECYRLGASLAYYAIFSIFPLLLLSATVLGYALGEGATTRTALVDAVTGATGSPAVRELLDETLASMQVHRTARGVGAVVGLLTLLFGASGVFSELTASLNRIWRVRGPASQSAGQAVVGFLRDKALSLAIVGLVGLLLFGSLALSTGLSAASNAARALPWQWIELAVSTAFLTLVLAAMLRALPRAHVQWRDALGGALVAALLLTVLKRLLAWYLAHLGSYAAYGVVGAVLGLLLLIYLASLVVFFGAELSRVYAERFGSLRGVQR